MKFSIYIYIYNNCIHRKQLSGVDSNLRTPSKLSDVGFIFFVGVSETKFDPKVLVLHFEVNLVDTKYFCVPESFRFL